MKKTMTVLAMTGLAAAANAQIGSVNDAYIFGDASSQVYQVKLDGTYVPGNYVGSGAQGNVFSNSTETRGISPYRASWGGVSNNFFIGGFGGMTEVDGNTGAFVRSYNTSGASLDNDISWNGNTVLASDSAGIGEYDIATGTRIRTVTAGLGVGGYHLMKTRGTDVYVSNWGFGNSGGIRKYDQITGVQDMSFNVATPFAVQAIEFDSFGNLYASSLYGNNNGVLKYDFNTNSWVMFANAAAAPGGSASGWPNGPHGFSFGPDGNLYQAFANGAVQVYNGTTGAWLRTLYTFADKLTDIQFKPVPTPGAMMAFGVAGVFAARRRRR